MYRLCYSHTEHYYISYKSYYNFYPPFGSVISSNIPHISVVQQCQTVPSRPQHHIIMLKRQSMSPIFPNTPQIPFKGLSQQPEPNTKYQQIQPEILMQFNDLGPLPDTNQFFPPSSAIAFNNQQQLNNTDHSILQVLAKNRKELENIVASQCQIEDSNFPQIHIQPGYEN
jgi:hypothetical protein